MAQSVVRQVRGLMPPAGFTTYIDGQTAYQMDLFHSLLSIIPFAALVIAVSIFLLLFLMTGSLVVPLKAIV
jgi:uncharacterized membrane protein YdfJ with MMPL/SSD domain